MTVSSFLSPTTKGEGAQRVSRVCPAVGRHSSLLCPSAFTGNCSSEAWWLLASVSFQGRPLNQQIATARWSAGGSELTRIWMVLGAYIITHLREASQLGSLEVFLCLKK